MRSIQENMISTNSCRIEWPSGDALRRRKVVKRSNHRVTGKFPSQKIGRMVEWESQIERDAILLHEVDHEVIAFREQPARIVFDMNGEEMAHFPDLLVETRGSSTFVEVKTDKDAKELDIRMRTAHLTMLLGSMGYGYALLVESEIRKEPRLANARYLHRYGKQSVDEYEEEKIRRAFNENGAVTWGQIHEGILGAYGVAKVCRLAIEGKIDLDLGVVWTNEMLVRMS